MQYAVTLFGECKMERTVLNVYMYVHVCIICCAIYPVITECRCTRLHLRECKKESNYFPKRGISRVSIAFS